MQAFYQITVLLVLDFAGEGILNLNYTGVSRSNDEETKNDEVRKTIIFNAFVFCQVYEGSSYSTNLQSWFQSMNCLIVHEVQCRLSCAELCFLF